VCAIHIDSIDHALAVAFTLAYMHTYQADLEKAEKDLAESTKVRALAD
jgi:hypothetical protein